MLFAAQTVQIVELFVVQYMAKGSRNRPVERFLRNRGN